jgi:hypothetical protein
MKALPLAEVGASAARAAWRAHAGLWLWRHGLWLPSTLALLLAAAGLGWDAMDLQARGQALATTATARAATPVPAPPRASADSENVAALRDLLPPATDATAQVRRLVELTRPQRAWQRAEFQQSEDAAGGVLRLQVTVPVAGEYAAMRQALDHSLAELPNLSLDQVQLRRVQPDATRLEARLRFSIWLAAASPGARTR